MNRAVLRPILATACACAFLLCGCTDMTPSSSEVSVSSESSASSSEAPQSSNILTIGYNPSNGWNPYVSPSILVVQNTGLIFEKLVEIAPDMSISYRIASAVECQGNQVTLHIRSGCSFADGTPITEADAAASIEAARSSELYAARFANVQRVTTEPGLVILTLAEPDSLFAYLCDIPVIKASETGSMSPTASGRYIYSESSQLVKNPHACFAEEDGPDTIQLTPVDSYEEMVSGLTVGSLNLYPTREVGDDSPSVTSSQTYYRTNNLIFLGINAKNAPEGSLLQTPAGRILLSKALDRRQLAAKSYYARAYAATGALNTFYPCAADQQSILPEAEYTPADVRAELENMGYILDPVSGYYQDANGQRLSLTLSVYSGSTYKKYAASLIQRQLGACGIEVLLDEVADFALWAEKVEQENFNLYIGEVKLYNNMDMSPFFSGGAASTGIVPNDALNAAYAAFKLDQNQAGAFESAFAAEMPYIPLLWRNGSLIHARTVSGLSPSVSNIFYSLAGLTVGSARNS